MSDWSNKESVWTLPLTGTIHVEAAVSDCVSAAGLLHHVETDGLVRGAAGRQSQAGHPAVGRALLALAGQQAGPGWPLLSSCQGTEETSERLAGVGERRSISRGHLSRMKYFGSICLLSYLTQWLTFILAKTVLEVWVREGTAWGADTKPEDSPVPG